MPVTAWVGGDHSLAIPVAGMLARHPELATAELTADEWAKRLDEAQNTRTDGQPPHILAEEAEAAANAEAATTEDA